MLKQMAASGNNTSTNTLISPTLSRQPSQIFKDPPASPRDPSSPEELYEAVFQTEKIISYPLRYKVSLSLSEREISLVRASWKLMLTDSKTAQTTLRQNKFSSATFSSSLFCHQFYDNLLDMKPDLTDLFPSLKHQAVSFAGIMNLTINSLEDLSALDSVLEHLGRTHSRILGIDSDYFELMGDALIKTLQDRYNTLLPDFTIELEDCWIKLYCFLANSILQSGIDPVIQLVKPQTIASSKLRNVLQLPTSLPPPLQLPIYQKTSRQLSESSLSADQETLFDRRSSILSTRKGSVFSSSSISKSSTVTSTKKALRSFTGYSSSSSSSSSASNLANGSPLTTTTSNTSTVTNLKTKSKIPTKLRRSNKKDEEDDGCVVM